VIARSNRHRGKGALTRATAQEPKLTRSELEDAFRALTSAGYRVMRFTYDDVVHEPDTVVARFTPRWAAA
jgi:very-short-patch-repair endonuclease